MSRNLLIGMFVAVIAAGGYILFDRSSEADTVVDPLRAIDFSSLRRIECAADGLEPWTMKRVAGDRWTLTSPELADGEAVAADSSRVQRIIGFLRDYKPHEQRDASEVDLSEWGLAPPEVTLTIDDGGAVHHLHFGKVDVDGELFYRSPDGKVLFKVGAEVTSDLRVDPRHLRHPGLCDAPPHLVKRVEIERGASGFTLERVANRWFVLGDDGSRRRGDPSLCDQLASALAAISGTPAAGAKASSDPLARVRLTDQSGGTHEYVVHGVDESTGGLFAQRGDEPDIRLTPKSARRWFERAGADLVDPIFTGFEPTSLAAIILEGPGRADRLEMVQKFGRWFVRFYDSFAWRTDPPGMSRVRDALLALRVERYVEAAEFDAVLVARFSFEDAGTGAPEVVVEVSAPRPDGLALVRRSDEIGAALVPMAALEPFRTRYWNVMARDVCTGNDQSIDRIAIESRESDETHEVARRNGTWETPAGREVPEEFLIGILGRLAYLSVQEYVGDIDDDAETGKALGAPLFTVAWHHPEPNTPKRPTADSPGVEPEKWWKLVRRLDDTRYACVCSIFPRLVFAVDAHDVTVIEDALRGIRGH